MPVGTTALCEKDQTAYEEMYALIRPVVKGKTVLGLPPARV